MPIPLLLFLAALHECTASTLILSTGVLLTTPTKDLHLTQAGGPHVIEFPPSIPLDTARQSLTTSLAVDGCGTLISYLPPTSFLVHVQTSTCLSQILTSHPQLTGNPPLSATLLPPSLRLGLALTDRGLGSTRVISLHLAPGTFESTASVVASACPSCAFLSWEASTALVSSLDNSHACANVTEASPPSSGCLLPLALLRTLAALPHVLYLDLHKAPVARNMHGRASQLTVDFANFAGAAREFGACTGGTPECSLASLVPFSQLPAALALTAAPPQPPPSGDVCTTSCSLPACGQGFGGPSCAGSQASYVEGTGLTGAGQIVQVVDSGADTGLPFFYDAAHPALRRRVNTPPTTASPHRKIADYWAFADGLDANGHGTHCAGSVAGHAGPAITQAVAAGAATPATAGAAPIDSIVLPLLDGTSTHARLAIADIQCDTPGAAGGCTTISPAPGFCGFGGFCTPSYSTIFDAHNSIGAKISSNSWGPPDGRGYYTQVSVDIDTYAYAHPDFLAVWAADNVGDARGSQSIGADASAKNVIAVGATQDGLLAHLSKVRGGTSRDPVTGVPRAYPPLLQAGSPFACPSVLAQAAINGFNVNQEPTNALCASLAANPVPVVVPGGYTNAACSVPGFYGAPGNFELPLCMGCTPIQLLPTATPQSIALFEWAYYSRFATCFSSIGPTADGRIKPDVTAPGTQIVSAASATQPGQVPDHPYGVWACGAAAGPFSNAGAAPAPFTPAVAETAVPFTTTEPLFIDTIQIPYTGATVGDHMDIDVAANGPIAVGLRRFTFTAAAGVATFPISHHFPANFGGAIFVVWGASPVTVSSNGDGVGLTQCFGTMGGAVVMTLMGGRGGGGAYSVALSGTSMSTPLVAGTVALVRQYFTDGYYSLASASPAPPSLAAGFAPSAALMKAVVVNSASILSYTDYCKLSGTTSFNCATVFPLSQVFAQGGHGVPSLPRGLGFAGGLGPATIAGGTLPSLVLPGLTQGPPPPPLATPDSQLRTPPFSGLDPTLSNGGANVYCVDVTAPPPGGVAPALPLSITLVWTDPPGSPLARYALVNNLDLEVTPPGGTPSSTWFGNNNASHFPQLPDNLNNVEKVYILSPAPTLASGGGTRLAAPYTVLVRGTRVPFGPQAYSVVVTGGGVRIAPPGTPGCGSDPAAAPVTPPPAAASTTPTTTVIALSSSLGVAGVLLGVAVGVIVWMRATAAAGGAIPKAHTPGPGGWTSASLNPVKTVELTVNGGGGVPDWGAHLPPPPPPGTVI